VEPLRLVDSAVLAATLARSRENVRGRANFNLHSSLDDPYQRFLNVFQPGSYVRPHRHGEGVFELFLVLAGRAAAVLFDDGGAVTTSAVLSDGGTRAAEIAAGTFHTLLAFEPDTVMFEIKPGPYRPLTEKDFAPWAPPEGDPAAASLLARWTALVSTP
jgi:cupin fold WbuC family metalloprotein